MSTANEDLMLKKCGYKCTLCEDVEIIIHHIDGNHDNDDLDNLTVLCTKHHVKAQTDLQITYSMTRKLTPRTLKKRRDERIEVIEKITKEVKITYEDQEFKQEIINDILKTLRESGDLN